MDPRPRGRGTIKQDPGGTWSLVVDTAPAGTVRRQIRRRGFRTKREAQAELNRLLHSLDEGAFVKPDRITVAEYLQAWLDAWRWRGIVRPPSSRTGGTCGSTSS